MPSESTNDTKARRSSSAPASDNPSLDRTKSLAQKGFECYTSTLSGKRGNDSSNMRQVQKMALMKARARLAKSKSKKRLEKNADYVRMVDVITALDPQHADRVLYEELQDAFLEKTGQPGSMEQIGFVFCRVRQIEPQNYQPRGMTADLMGLHPGYTIEKKIGAGGYASVYKATDISGKKAVAVKRVEVGDMWAGEMVRIYREVFLLRQIKHPAICTPFYVTTAGATSIKEFTHVDMYFPLMSGDLRALLIDKNTAFARSHVKMLMQQLLDAMSHLHSRKIVHRDLKPENILIQDMVVLQICDFGLARCIPGRGKSLMYHDDENDELDDTTRKTPRMPGPNMTRGSGSGPGRLRAGTVIEQFPPHPQRKGRKKKQRKTETWRTWNMANRAMKSVIGKFGKGEGRVGIDDGETVRSSRAGGDEAGFWEPAGSAGRNRSTTLTRQGTIPTKRRRRMTQQAVGTLWYRAPELILKQMYDEAVDMWSVGLIFGEMLWMIADKMPRKRRSAMFPGLTCHPLTEERDATGRDQLDMIVHFLGAPGPSEMEQTTSFNKEAKEYLLSVAEELEHPCVEADGGWDTLEDIAASWPNVLTEDDRRAGRSTCQAHQLLTKLLCVDPETRATVDEARSHPYLVAGAAEAREPRPARPVQMPSTVNLEGGADCQVSKKDITTLLFEEVYYNWCGHSRKEAGSIADAGRRVRKVRKGRANTAAPAPRRGLKVRYETSGAEESSGSKHSSSRSRRDASKAQRRASKSTSSRRSSSRSR